jgi:7,8-dihydro-6-hydroxymethylpterin-pyrophosphokinase
MQTLPKTEAEAEAERAESEASGPRILDVYL